MDADLPMTVWQAVNTLAPDDQWPDELRDVLAKPEVAELTALTAPVEVWEEIFAVMPEHMRGRLVDLGISGAHTHDSQALRPLLKGILAIRSHRDRRQRRQPIDRSTEG